MMERGDDKEINFLGVNVGSDYSLWQPLKIGAHIRSPLEMYFVGDARIIWKPSYTVGRHYSHNLYRILLDSYLGFGINCWFS